MTHTTKLYDNLLIQKQNVPYSLLETPPSWFNAVNLGTVSHIHLKHGTGIDHPCGIT